MECLREVQNSLVGESCLVGIVPPPLSLLSRRGDVEGMGGALLAVVEREGAVLQEVPLPCWFEERCKW